jgi:hypothetical protein
MFRQYLLLLENTDTKFLSKKKQQKIDLRKLTVLIYCTLTRNGILYLWNNNKGNYDTCLWHRLDEMTYIDDMTDCYALCIRYLLK